MKKFIPYEKMSKKQKREIDRQQRGTWIRSPVTRIAETDKKHYSRKIKHKDNGGDDGSSLPLFISTANAGSFGVLQARLPRYS